jgi:hypothetical protein
MKLFKILGCLFLNPYFNNNIDYLYFNKPVCFINLKRRQSILTKWYNYDHNKIYRPIKNDLPHTFIWSPNANKTQHVQYLVIGKLKDEIFEVAHIIPRPYILDGNMLQLKSDLEHYNTPLRFDYYKVT